MTADEVRAIKPGDWVFIQGRRDGELRPVRASTGCGIVDAPLKTKLEEAFRIRRGVLVYLCSPKADGATIPEMVLEATEPRIEAYAAQRRERAKKALDSASRTAEAMRKWAHAVAR